MTKGCFRTDLAAESFPSGKGLPREAEYKSEKVGSFTVERMHLSCNAGKKFGKPAGSYTTVSFGRAGELSDTDFSGLCDLVASELVSYVKRATGKSVGKELCVLVAGIGNAKMTPDSIGPGTVARLNVTRHLSEAEPELFSRLGCSKLCAVAPGVLGQTGIEASRLISCAAEAARPDVIIAIDALAAGACDRLFSTVQLSDSGIAPGSGIGNRRSELSLRTLGVPVIALGVPTVVDSSTLVTDALGRAGFSDIPDELAAILESGRSYFVSPKDCDALTKSFCRLFSSAINRAFGVDLGLNI